MKLVIFGLTVSSSWGNGHATLWRGLWHALARHGHEIIFFEKDVPYYAAQRDVTAMPGGQLILYPDWASILPEAKLHLADADVAMVTSYCPDGRVAADLVLSSTADRKVFYDLDTPVTLSRIAAGEDVPFLPAAGLGDFDLVLSYTGGSALEQLQTKLHAKKVAPLYGHVDPQAHFPVPADEQYRADLSYLGTYAADRQAGVEQLFLAPARQLKQKKFTLAGAQYPQDFPWADNIYFFKHLPPPQHPVFLCSSRMTLNVTREAMAAMGYCPSGRLFESAACGCPVLSDWWEGLDEFYTPGKEILIARTTEEAIAALELSDAEVNAVARAARERTLEEHTSEVRADHLIDLLERLT